MAWMRGAVISLLALVWMVPALGSRWLGIRSYRVMFLSSVGKQAAHSCNQERYGCFRYGDQHR